MARKQASKTTAPARKDATGMKKLTFKSATIYFIYSFCIGRKDSYLVEAKDVLGPKPIEAWKKDIGRPPQRSSIMPHLKFKPQDEGWIQFPELSGSISLGASNLDAKINRLVRILHSGASCCIAVELSECDVAAVMHVIALARLREGRNHQPNRLSLVNFDYDPDYTMFDLFRKTIESFLDRTNHFWLEKKKGVIELEEKEGGDKKEGADKKEIGEPQSPWVVTLLETDDAEVRRCFCSDFSDTEFPLVNKLAAVRPYLPEIAPMLYRSVVGMAGTGLVLEPAYITANGILGLSSMNLDARLFVVMSSRSILCICPDKETDPAKYFIPGLLDLCEMVRVRWHVLVVMHRLIDHTVRDLRRDKEMEDQFDELIRLREWFSTSLEDPGIYILAGDALSKLHRQLQEIFRLAELKDAMVEKINLLDKLYADVIQSDYAKQMAARVDRNRKDTGGEP